MHRLALLAPIVVRATRRQLVRFAVLAAVLLAVAGPIRDGAAQAPSQASERSIKAAFLYKFTEYVEWPATPEPPGQPFTIGVLGSNALAQELMRMTEDRTVLDRPIAVRTVSPNDPVDDLQVLFVAGDQRGRIGELLAPAAGRPILTVTEAVGALADGSIINFTVRGDRVRFEVSLDAAQSSRLRLSSRLLAVAERVFQSP